MSLASSESKKLSLIGLYGVSMGATIGSGVFTMPGDFAKNGAFTGAVLIGWLICGIGMIGLIYSLFGLNKTKPEVVGGISAYAQEGWGDYVGFSSTTGYWLGVVTCNVAYATLIFGSLSNFFPVFGGGNNLVSIICASLFYWAMCYLICSGIKKASLVNLIILAAKVIPVIIFMVSIPALGRFDFSIFMDNFWGDATIGVFDQVRSTATITVWAFIGIEGCLSVSAKAEKRSDVGKAVVGAFLSVLGIYIFISVLSMGVLPKEELAALATPSMGSLLEQIVGKWGAKIISIGAIVSMAGASLTTTIISAHIPSTAAKRGKYLEFFAKENKNEAPQNAAVASALIIQLFLIITYFSSSTYMFFYGVSVSLMVIPYFLSSFYYLKVLRTHKREDLGYSESQMTTQLIIALIGTVYAIWIVYSAGLSRLLLTTLILLPGSILYIKSQKEKGKEVFIEKFDKLIFILFVVGAILSIIFLMTGRI